MTKTSEGPAGMSIEIIASLFCYVNKRKNKESNWKKDQHFLARQRKR
jgi:hypothetical protein